MLKQMEKKEVKQFTNAGVVNFKTIYSLRTLPITDERLIKTIKLLFDAYTQIPFDIEVCENELQILLNAYSQPLSHHSNERRIVRGKKASMQNLLMLLRGAKLENLHTYVLSSLFTFCYFLKKHREENDLLRDAYQRVKTDDAVISLRQIRAVIELILSKDKLDLVNLERLRSVFRKGSVEQMHELFNSQEYLLSEVSEEKEICMKFYFQCLETDCKPVIPSKACEVFYNREGKPLFIYCKKLMTEAEIEEFEEKFNELGKKNSRGLDIMKKDIMNEKETEGGDNGARGSHNENNDEVLAQMEMRKELLTSHRKENIVLPADDAENDEVTLNEEPNPGFSDLTTYETDSSIDELSKLMKIINHRNIIDFQNTTATATATAIIPTRISTLTKADITTGLKIKRTRFLKHPTASTKLSLTEASDDESPEKSPEKKRRHLIDCRIILTKLSSEEIMKYKISNNNVNIKSDVPTDISEDIMYDQPPNQNNSRMTSMNATSLSNKYLIEKIYPGAARVTTSTLVYLPKPVEKPMLIKSQLSTMEEDSQITMVEDCKHSNQSPTNVTMSMPVLSNQTFEQHTELIASNSVHDMITNFSSDEHNQILDTLKRNDLPVTLTDVRNPVTGDTKHLSRNLFKAANKISTAKMPRTNFLQKRSTRAQDHCTENTLPKKSSQERNKMKYKQLDVVLVKFNDGGLWPSIILLKMKKGKKYKIASLYKKIIYNVEAKTIQDLNFKDFEYALEKIEDNNKKDQLRKAIIVANRLSNAGKIKRQKYIDEILKERKRINIDNEFKKK